MIYTCVSISESLPEKLTKEYKKVRKNYEHFVSTLKSASHALDTLTGKYVALSLTDPLTAFTPQTFVNFILERIKNDPNEYERLCNFLRDTNGMDLILERIQRKTNINVNEDVQKIISMCVSMCMVLMYNCYTDGLG